MLMRKLKNCDYNETAYRVVIDKNVLKERIIENQIMLLEALENCNYNENSFYVAINPDILQTITVDEQIDLMEVASYIGSKKSKEVNHSKNMKKISDITELKMYLKELKKKLGKDADVKSDTMVLEFIPDKKDRRKEN